MDPAAARAYRRSDARRAWTDRRRSTSAMLLVVSVIIAALATTDAGAKIARREPSGSCARSAAARLRRADVRAATTPAAAGADSDLRRARPLTGQDTVAGSLPVPRLGHGHAAPARQRASPEDVRARGPARRRRCRPAARLDDRAHADERSTTTAARRRRSRSQTTLAARRPTPRPATRPSAARSQAYLGQATKYEVTVSPGAADAIGDGDRDTPNPVDPTHARPRREHPAHARTSTPASAPRAPTGRSRSRWATTRARACRAASRASARRTVRVHGRRRGLRPPGARRSAFGVDDFGVCARQHQGPQRRPAARRRHRHLDPGRLGRLPGVLQHRAGCRRRARRGTSDPDAGRDGRLHRTPRELEAKLGGAQASAGSSATPRAA